MSTILKQPEQSEHSARHRTKMSIFQCSKKWGILLVGLLLLLLAQNSMATVRKEFSAYGLRLNHNPDPPRDHSARYTKTWWFSTPIFANGISYLDTWSTMDGFGGGSNCDPSAPLTLSLRINGNWETILVYHTKPGGGRNDRVGPFEYDPPLWFSSGPGGMVDGFRIDGGDSTSSCLWFFFQTTFVIDFTPKQLSVAKDDYYSGTQDTLLGVVVPGILENDPGLGFSTVPGVPEWLSLEAALLRTTTNGSLTFGGGWGSGGFGYQPNPGFCGHDEFQYVSGYDPNMLSSPATVNLEIECTNEPPGIIAHNAIAEEDAGPQSGVIVGSAFSPGAANESAQSLAACIISDVADVGGILTEGPVVTIGGAGNNECHLSYTGAANAFGSASFNLQVKDNGGLPGVDTSAKQRVTVTINPVNDPPGITVHDSVVDEDAGTHSAVVVGDNFSTGPANELDILAACNTSDLNVPDGLLASGPTVTLAGSECHLAYTPADNAFGSFNFMLSVQDSGSDVAPNENSSISQLVTIAIKPVNDPPVITGIVDESSPFGSQTLNYSDHIETVTITAHDIDSPSSAMNLLLSASLLPSAIPSPGFASTASCSDSATTITGTGQQCTWTMNGQGLDPAMAYNIVFGVDDGSAVNNSNDCAASGNVCNYSLTVKAEDAMVLLDAGNEVAVEVAAAGGNSGEFHLMYSAWELNEPDNPHDGTPAFGDLNTMVPDILMLPVGPGDPEIPDVCTFIPEAPSFPAQGYAQTGLFDCTFTDVPVNSYQVYASVDGGYYTGMDAGALVVYDPSLGSSKAHAKFYWPGTAIDDVTDPCDGYPGDKTDLAYDISYKKKGSKVQGKVHFKRHTIDPLTCEDAGGYDVKSKAVYGVSIGSDTDADGDFGWAAIAGESTYREPGGEKERDFLFFLYAEDHNKRKCKSGPPDKIWIEVWDRDKMAVVQLNGADGVFDAEDVKCGSVEVGHKPKK